MSRESRSSSDPRPSGPPSPGRVAAAVMVAALAVGGCAALQQPPSVRVLGLRVASLGIRSGTAELDLELTYDAGGSIEVEGVRYRVDVQGAREGEDDPGWIKLGEGFHAEELTVRAGDTTRVTVLVPFEYEAVGAAVRSFLREGEVRYRLDGDVWIRGGLGRIQVPVRSRGSVGP